MSADRLLTRLHARDQTSELVSSKAGVRGHQSSDSSTKWTVDAWASVCVCSLVCSPHHRPPAPVPVTHSDCAASAWTPLCP